MPSPAPADSADSDDDRLVVDPRIAVPRSEFEFSFVRSSGPGGQNVNKVATKARLRWPVLESPSLPEDVRERFVARHRRRITREGEFVISSQRYRDQARNVADCLDKLREMLADAAVAPKRRKKTKPSRGARERRLTEKRQQSERKRRRRPPRREE
ncbi:MAG: alternative ribosome rescue aminoacyl-tRNA hydrolase ArfB [Planctomycetales bacterium]